MTSVVYPLLETGDEFRYSLRSLDKFMSGVGDVFVVGTDPGMKGIIHIPFNDRKTVKVSVNIWEKLQVIADDARVSERFVWMNDDFYIARPCEASKLRTFIRPGGLQRYKGRTKQYHKMLENTCIALESRGLGSMNFGTHQPITLEKKKVKEAFEEFKSEIYSPVGISFRCAYGNFHKLDGLLRGTVVIRTKRETLPNRWAFASQAGIEREALHRLIGPLLPEKSQYEAA